MDLTSGLACYGLLIVTALKLVVGRRIGLPRLRLRATNLGGFTLTKR
jgi:hypothetical protein